MVMKTYTLPPLPFLSNFFGRVSGINVRYLGHLYHHLESPYLKELVFIETCCRVIKNHLREALRNVCPYAPYAF